MASTPQIAIIGGGPGGLTLARILQTKGIPVTVFERETSRESRQQGGTLDLHPESGQYALRIAGLFERFEALARYEGQDMRITNKDATILLDEVTPEDEKSRPEIDRSALRDILLDSLNPDTIRWGHNLKSITPKTDAQSQHLLHFENLSDPVVADLVISADGTWSRVRPYISPAIPSYTGVSFVEIHLSDIDARYPALASLVGRGSLCALQGNKGMIAQRNSGSRVRVYCALRVPESWHKETTMTRDGLLEYFADWSPSLTDLIRHCDDDFGLVTRPIYALPILPSWTHVDGITILGDAAHAMSPFAGKGVNLAMQDATDLGIAIAEKTSIAAFEKTMLERSSAAAEESASNMDVFIHPDAPKTALDRMAELMARGPPPEH